MNCLLLTKPCPLASNALSICLNNQCLQVCSAHLLIFTLLEHSLGVVLFQASGTVYDASITVKGLKSNYTTIVISFDTDTSYMTHASYINTHKHTHIQTYTFDSKLQVPCLLTASQLNKRHQAHMPITYTSIPILTVHL